MFGDWCAYCLSYTRHESMPCPNCGLNCTICKDCGKGTHP